MLIGPYIDTPKIKEKLYTLQLLLLLYLFIVEYSITG